MGLQTNRRNHHDSDYPVSQHHYAQILRESKLQRQRLAEIDATYYKLLSKAKNLDGKNIALEGVAAVHVVATLNQLRDAKEALNTVQHHIGQINQTLSMIVSAADVTMNMEKK